MTTSQKISALAEKAVEARKAFLETELPVGCVGHSALFANGLHANTAYHNAATPEAWLALRNEADEANLKIAQQFNRIAALRNEVLEECARVAINGCLVPPDGGSPTKQETDLCDHIAEAIRARITKRPA